VTTQLSDRLFGSLSYSVAATESTVYPTESPINTTAKPPFVSHPSINHSISLSLSLHSFIHSTTIVDHDEAFGPLLRRPLPPAQW